MPSMSFSYEFRPGEVGSWWGVRLNRGLRLRSPLSSGQLQEEISSPCAVVGVCVGVCIAASLCEVFLLDTSHISLTVADSATRGTKSFWKKGTN